METFRRSGNVRRLHRRVCKLGRAIAHSGEACRIAARRRILRAAVILIQCRDAESGLPYVEECGAVRPSLSGRLAMKEEVRCIAA